MSVTAITDYLSYIWYIRRRIVAFEEYWPEGCASDTLSGIPIIAKPTVPA